MKSRAFLLAAFLLASVSLWSQDNETKENITYSNISEFGFSAASPKGFAYEATTVNGFAVDKKHCFGIGLGMGYILRFYDDDLFALHTPVFLNYRCYFKPEKAFSPHVNVALGGMMIKEGGGIYSAVTMGFRAKKFSFSSGFSFMAFENEERDWDYSGWDYRYRTIKKWRYPFGITLKCGFTF